MRAMNWAEAFQPKQEIVKANLSGHKEHASFDPGAITNTVRVFMGMNNLAAIPVYRLIIKESPLEKPFYSRGLSLIFNYRYYSAMMRKFQNNCLRGYE
jgi:hypothetical protein